MCIRDRFCRVVGAMELVNIDIDDWLYLCRWFSVYIWRLRQTVFTWLQPAHSRSHPHWRPTLRLSIRRLHQEVCAVDQPKVTHFDTRKAQVSASIYSLPNVRYFHIFIVTHIFYLDNCLLRTWQWTTVTAASLLEVRSRGTVCQLHFD